MRSVTVGERGLAVTKALHIGARQVHGLHAMRTGLFVGPDGHVCTVEEPDPGQRLRRGGELRSFTCLQCDEAWCMNACPVNAIAIDPATGAKVVIDSACIGCHLCSIACPFGTVFTLPQSGKAAKCDLCGGQPACATPARRRRSSPGSRHDGTVAGAVEREGPSQSRRSLRRLKVGSPRKQVRTTPHGRNERCRKPREAAASRPDGRSDHVEEIRPDWRRDYLGARSRGPPICSRSSTRTSIRCRRRTS